jgi:outer membrane protein TolC
MLGHWLSVRAFRLRNGRPAGMADNRPCARSAGPAGPLLAAACVLLALAGCASFSPDAGMDVVTGTTAAALQKDAVKIDSEDASANAQRRVRALLGASLSADAAVQAALLQNRGLQAAYNDLGIAETLRIASSLPPNPTFGLSRIATPVELDVERAIAVDILALATLPARSRIAADRFHAAQLQAAAETLRVAAETRRNYYRAVAARGVAAFLDEASSAARTAAAIAKRLGETGAMNKLDQTREQAFSVEIETRRAEARQRAVTAREALIRSVGLDRDDPPVKLPSALPPLPKAPRAGGSIETEAIRRRVDLQIARLEVEALAKSYGLVNATRFISLLDLSVISRTQRETIGPRGTGGGLDVAFQVPIFDFGEVSLRQAGESYMAAVNRLTQRAVDVRSEARAAYRAYRSAYAVAVRYRDEVLPLYKVIADETTLRYGAMQVDVFALLTEARQRVAANIAAIQAQRDFWLASTDLDAAIFGGGVTPDDGAARESAGPSRVAAGE